MAVDAAGQNLLCTCGARGKFSAPVCAIIVRIAGRERPVPLLPEREHTYRLCTDCDALYRFVTQAVSLAPVTAGEQWTEALIVFDDHQLVGLKNRDAALAPVALA